MNVHPLAFIGAAHCEAWVDDIVVEKIAGDKETMVPLLRKETPTMEEIQILARYHLWRKEPGKTWTLMEKADNYTKADIACLLAQQTPDRRRRMALISDMVRFGGLGYSNGHLRFGELTTDLTPAEKFEVVEVVVLADPASRSAAKFYRDLLEQSLSGSSPAATLADLEGLVDPVFASFERVRRQLPDGAAFHEEVETVKKTLAKAREQCDRRRASLGRCIIQIGGKDVTPASHAIVIPRQATPQEQHAAIDLQAHLELLTGERLPILREGESKGRRKFIAVGRTDLLKKHKVKVDWDWLGKEGIWIETSGKNLFLAGGPRGVLYACYTFLEDFLGVRWLAPDCTLYPREGIFELGQIRHHYLPPFEYREPFAFSGFDADWAVRNKSNGSATRIDPSRGGKILYKGFVHTFYGLVPPGQYFAQHPEFFSEINGQRQHQHGQLCLTNPQLEDCLVDAVKNWLRESPEATIVSVSQNDWHGNCQCANCRAVDEAEGSPAGSLLQFINRVAQRIEQEFPEVAIDTLAYQYTRKPPKLTRPRRNVIVRLCSIECSFAQTLGNSPQNESFRQDIEGWGKICQRLYVWDYVTNFAHYIQPHPNLHVLQPNIQFFLNNGVKGIFEQGGYQSLGGEFQELRTWLLAKLLWKPDADVEALMQEFLDGYYGPAAPFVRQYIDRMRRSVEETGTYLNCFSPPHAPFLTPQVVAEAQTLFESAEQAVKDDPVLLRRVEIARLPLLYTNIARGRSVYQEQADRLVANPADALAPITRFERIARSAGATHVSEGAPNLEAWVSAIRNQPATLPIERLSNGHLEAFLLPQPGGRIWRLRHRVTGKEIIRPFGTEAARDPTQGGYEEYSQTGYRSPGWSESYTVVERTERSIVLQADLTNGLRLARRIELDAQRPLLRITSTLSNLAKAGRPACLRIHPAFSVAETAQAAVWLKDTKGAWQRRSFAQPDDPLAEKEIFLRGDARPAGEWVLVDETDGLGLITRFKPEQVDQCLLNWSGKQRRVNLELWTASQTLKSGESLTVDHEWEVAHPLPERFRP